MTEHRWQGSALLRPVVLAFIGSIGATDRHAHHAVQIITATTALTVVDGTDVRHCGTKVIVPADAAHRIETGAAAGSVVFLKSLLPLWPTYWATATPPPSTTHNWRPSPGRATSLSGRELVLTAALTGRIRRSRRPLGYRQSDE